jgi:hypothetical protein
MPLAVIEHKKAAAAAAALQTVKYTSYMAEPHTEPKVEQKPGTGIDRTTIQRMLTLTPAERIKLAVREANNLAKLMEKMRIR